MKMFSSVTERRFHLFFYRNARIWEWRIGSFVVQWDRQLWVRGELLPIQIWRDRF